MRRITIAAGVERNEYGHRLKIWYVSEQLEYIRKAMAEAVGGFTETETREGYTHVDGSYVEERGVQWTLYYDGASPHMGYDLAELVRSSLLQESVVLTEEEVNVRFVRKERGHVAA